MLLIVESSRNQFITNLNKQNSDKVWFCSLLRKKKLDFFEISSDNIIVGSGFYFDKNNMVNLSFFINQNKRRKGIGSEVVNYFNQNFEREIQIDVDVNNQNSILFFCELKKRKIIKKFNYLCKSKIVRF